MTMDLTPFTPDCGHTVTPKPGSVGTGKATDPDTGRTMCYPCAETAEREAIRTADVYSGYITDSRPKEFTTWTGAVLGKVTSCIRGAKQFGNDGPYRMRSVTVRTPDGAEWYGRGKDDMDAITIRRSKKTA